MKALDPHTEADPVGILNQFVTMFGNIVGNNPYYLVESDRHHTNLFSVQVAVSAKGRKGTAAGRVKAVTILADKAWSEERMASGLSSGEGLINAVRDPDEKWDAKAKVPNRRSWCRRQAPDDNRARICRRAFGHGAARQHAVACYTKCVGRAEATDANKASPLKATGAHVSIIAHITETETRARLSRTEMANGFANRFLFCCVKRSKLLPHGGDLNEGV